MYFKIQLQFNNRWYTWQGDDGQIHLNVNFSKQNYLYFSIRWTEQLLGYQLSGSNEEIETYNILLSMC